VLAEPREFLVVDDMATALRAIKKSAGYHHDVEGVAVKLDPNHKVEELVPGADPPIGPPRPFIVLDLSEPDEFDYATTKGHVLVVRPFRIVWVNDTDPEDDASLLKTYFRGIADIEQAITQDVSRGQRAIDTRILNREMREPEGQMVWASVVGQIRIDRPYGQPNG